MWMMPLKYMFLTSIKAPHCNCTPLPSMNIALTLNATSLVIPHLLYSKCNVFFRKLLDDTKENTKSLLQGILPLPSPAIINQPPRR